MNLTRALDVALPEIPARTLAARYPRLDPGATFREHLEDGEPIVRIYIPSVEGMYKLTPANWKLAQMFDGKRSYEEIAQLYSQQTGVEYDTGLVREFSDALEGGGFWYKTPQEKNILLMQQTTEERRKKLQTRSKWADLSMVIFPAFNPDKFLNWLYKHTKFIYTPWCTALTLIAFGISAGITITHWGEIGRDTLEFYNFTNKTWGDVFALYAIGMIIVAIHEFAHAHACKHYGGRVTSMGFALVYLTPAFYTDTTEGAVMGSRYQRLVISLAGIWSELMVCAIATPIWWGTPPDTFVHNAAYFMMMLTGIMSLIVNWNPLMKLDGYHMLCEVIGISDLKENSTLYVTSWIKKNVWRLPVEVPYVPRQRKLGFVVYAILSGAYSYMVLYVVARFAGNFVRNFSPEWGFIPEIAVALLIFRSRIRILVNLMKFVYLDKKDRIVAWFTPGRLLAGAGVAIVLFALPVWRDSVSGKFLLEPRESAVVRTVVPGSVSNVFVREGEMVSAGTALATLHSLPMEAEFENAKTRLVMASERARAASLHYSAYGEALKEKEETGIEEKQLSEKNSALEITSPMAGTILTPRLNELVGTYLPEGALILEIGDLSVLKARIYISEYELAKVREGARARIQIQGKGRIWNAQVSGVAVRPSEMDPRLLGQVDLKGMNPPHFYLVDLVVTNADGELKPGMMGVARVYSERRSLFALGWEAIRNFFGRKIW